MMMRGWKQPKALRPTKPYNLFSTFLSPLELWQFQLCPCRQRRVGPTTQRVTSRVAHKVEVRHVPEGGGGNFGQDTEGVNTIVDHNGDPNKSGYLNFDPGGISTINWSPTGFQVSKYSRAPGDSQFQIPVIIQLDHQLYQSQRIIAKG